jgi:SAM-dependent methyltransferase
MSLLDCGCGPGSITVDLAELVAPGHVVGIDREPSQIAAATGWAAQKGIGNARFVVAGIHELPFPDASFDAALANALLVYVRDPLAALCEIRRVLKPGGVIGVCDGLWDRIIWGPRTPPVQQALHLLRRALEHAGGQPAYAHDQPDLLQAAGFVRTQTKLSSEHLTGQVAGSGWMEYVVGAFENPALVETLVSQGWIEPSELPIMITALLAWEELPNAYYVGFNRATIGWADARGSGI